MSKQLRELSPRLQRFRKAVEGYGMVLKHVRGATNLAADSMSRAPVGSPEEVEKVLSGMGSKGNRYVYNRIVSSVWGDISNEVLEDPALVDLWEAAEADEEYSRAAKVIADKVKMKEVMKMDKHPIKPFRRWAYRLSVIENKKGTRLLLLDATCIVVLEALREQLVIQAHVGHQGISKMCMDVAAKYFWPHYKTDIAETCASCNSFQQHGRSQQAQPLRRKTHDFHRPQSLHLEGGQASSHGRPFFLHAFPRQDEKHHSRGGGQATQLLVQHVWGCKVCQGRPGSSFLLRRPPGLLQGMEYQLEPHSTILPDLVWGGGVEYRGPETDSEESGNRGVML